MQPDTSAGTAYASNESIAEHGPSHSNNDESNADGHSDEKNNEKLDFRKDAHVWYLYLEDAEREANEKAELWKSGLDSLLIFAGLFGGIVSSFVLDARKDLQVDSEQNLLSDIRQTLLSGSINQTPGISAATEWVNGLWVLSLYITLFSAITGVLAKTWLMNYVSVTKRREAEDAYKRYRLDKHADQWYLKEVVTIVPLLLQIATFLFLVGLVIRGYGDSPTLSSILLAFCAAGGAIYLLMTVLPFISPTSPFNTPLSDFLQWLKRMWKALRLWSPSWSPSRPTSVLLEMEVNHSLAEILYKKSIKSPKASHVNAAVAEIALPSFKEKWVDHLCQTDTPQILLSHFVRCATDLTHDGALQHPAILANCLLALLRSVKCVEGSMSVGNHVPKVTQRNALAIQLRKSLSDPGNPLHRWNSLPESFRPLLFSLRTQVLHLLPLLDWSRVDSKPDVDFGDFDAIELADQPWNMAWQDISSNHRIHFTVAASRGVLHGQKHMKTVSSMILSLCLARAAHTAIDTGRVSEWVGFTNAETKQGEIGKLVSTYLEKLYGTTASAWGDMAIDALAVYLQVPSLSVTVADLDSTDTLQTLDVLRSLLSALSHERRRLPIHAVKMLEQGSIPGGELLDTTQTLQRNPDRDRSPARSNSLRSPTQSEAPILLSESGHLSMVETIATLIVCEHQYGVRELGVQILENLATDEDSREKITSILAASIESALINPEPHAPISAIDFLRTLYGLPKSPLYRCIYQVMFGLVDVALGPNPNKVRQLALGMVHDLWTQVELQADIKKAITKYLRTSLYDRCHQVLCQLWAGIEILKCGHAELDDVPVERPPFLFPWAKSADFCKDVVGTLLSDIIKLAIYDEDSTTRHSSQQFLKQLDRTGYLVNSISNLDPLVWLKDAPLLNKRNLLWAHQNFILVAEMFVNRLVIDQRLLEKLVGMAVLDNDDVCMSSIRLLSSIFNRYCSNPTPEPVDGVSLKTAILSAKKTIVTHRWGDPRRCASWIPLIGEMARHVHFPEAVPIMLELWIESAIYEDEVSQDTESPLLSILGKEEFWAGNSEYPVALEKAIPGELGVSLDGSIDDWSRLQKWVDLLVSLSAQPILKQIVDRALDKTSDDIRSWIANADVGHDELEYLCKSRLSRSLRRLLDKIKGDRCIIWVEIVAALASYAPHKFGDAPGIIVQIAIYDTDDDVRSVCLESLLPLMGRDEVRKLVKVDLINNHNSFLSNDDWRVRQFSIRLLASLGLSEKGKLFENVLEGLKDMALSDLDADVQSEAINALSNLLEAHAEHYHDSIVPTIEQHLTSGVEDTERKVRLAWVKLASSQLNDVDFPRVQKFIEAALKESDDDVITEAVQTLRKILKTKLRAQVASELGKKLNSSLRNPELAARALSIYTTLTARESTPEGRQSSVERHQLWIEIITLLSRYPDFQTLNKLIKQTIKEDWSGLGFPSLELLFKTVNLKLPESLNNILPKAFEFSLDPKKNATTEARVQATELFGRLIGCRPNEGNSQVNCDDLLGKDRDARIISLLADLSIKDSDARLRAIATALLKTAFQKCDRFRDLIQSALSEVIKQSIQSQESVNIRLNAAQVVNSLTRPAAGDPFHDVVSPSITALLRVGLTEGDIEHEHLRNEVQKILFTNLASFAEEIKLNRDILTEIPHLITVMPLTLLGKEAILELVDRLVITDKTAASIARALSSILRNTSISWVARTASIELLSRLHEKYSRSWPRLIEPAIHEIIAVALDHKDPMAIRKPAVRLLASLATPPTSDTYYFQVIANQDFRDEIMLHGQQFIALLKDDHLRSPVVELLSILSTDIEIRRKISMSILTSAMSTESKSWDFVGQVELLARLISDGRFLHEPIDIVMLLVASALVTRPILKNTPYRLEILTALWCRYKLKDVPAAAFEHKDLKNWFTFGLFGRHTTRNEVDTWSKGCKEWLSRKVISSRTGS